MAATPRLARQAKKRVPRARFNSEPLERRLFLSAVAFNSVSYSAGAFPYGLVTADFNNDGHPDLVSSTNTPTISVWLGSANGSFNSTASVHVAGAYVPVAAGDFNGDGNQDLVVLDGDNNQVGIMDGNGNGTFQQPVMYPTGNAPFAAAVGDFNGDNRPDLVVVDRFGNNAYVFPNGPSGLGTPQIFPLGSGGLSATVADVDGDGNSDVIIGTTSDSSFVVLYGDGHGGFQSANYTIPNAGNVAIADFNGDHIPDLVANDYANADVQVLLGQGNRTFSAPVRYPTYRPSNYVAVADMNQDGKLDVVTEDSGITVLFGNGDGTFAAPFTPATLQGTTQFDPGLVTTDFNADGFADIAYPTSIGSAGTLNVLLNQPFGFEPTNALSTYQLNNATLATLVDNVNPAAPASSLTASINWGDGQSGGGTVVSGGDGTFQINGSHTYGQRGSFTISISVSDGQHNAAASLTDDVEQLPNPAGYTSFNVGLYAPGQFVPGPGGRIWFGYVHNNPSSGTTTPEMDLLSMDGSITKFPTPIFAGAVTSDSAGDIWFANSTIAAQAGVVERLDAGGNLTQFSVPGTVFGLAPGPDGGMWFLSGSSQTSITALGEIRADGSVVTDPLSTTLEFVQQLYFGPSGDFWAGDPGDASILRITPQGGVTSFATGAGSSGQTQAMVVGPDGNLWFTESGYDWIGRMTPAGQVTQFATSTSPQEIAVGPDGAIWFSELQQIGRITTGGSESEYASNTNGFFGLQAVPYSIAAGGDGNIWLGYTSSEGGSVIGRLNLNDVPAVTAAISPLRRQIGFSGPVATFTDPTGQRSASDFSASINWGDGTTGPGTIVAANGQFSVNASHAYATEGSFKLSVTITPLLDVPVTGYTQTQVVDYPLAPGQTTPIATTAAMSTPAPALATFSDTDPNGAASQFTVTIDWGDGSQSPGTISTGGGELFTIGANHTYQMTGNFVVTIHVADAGGATLDMTTSATVAHPPTFVPFATVNLSSGPTAMTAADMNGDGISDLVVADYGILVLPGQANGPLGSPITTNLVISQQSPNAIAIGDFNGDGKKDVFYLFANASLDIAGALFGNGDGTFSSAVNPTFGVPSDPTVSQKQLAVADFNGDGKDDIVTSGDSNNVQVLLSNGNGTFLADPISLPSTHHYSVAAGDFNGDGKADIAVAMSDPLGNDQIAVLFGNGDGTFKAPVTYGIGSTAPLGPLLAGDLNGDKKPDLLLIDQQDAQLMTMLNTGAGVFSATPFAPLEVNSPSGTPGFVSGAVLADLNGDGTLDLAFTDTRDMSMRVRAGAGNGAFLPDVRLALGHNPYGGVAAGDFNHDGLTDLAEGGTQYPNIRVVQEFISSPVRATADAAIAVEGVAQPVNLVTFYDDFPALSPPQSYAALINWGNGSSSTGTISAQGNSFVVSGINPFTESGTQAATITITGPAGPLAIVPVQVTVADATLSIASQAAPSVVVNNPATMLLGTFTDQNPYAPLSDFSATITWGDGTSSSGVIRAVGNGSFAVMGTHSYSAGSSLRQASITVKDVDGAQVVINDSVHVAAIQHGGGSVSGNVFVDANSDGIREFGETPIPFATAYLDLNGNGVLDPGEPSALSAADGNFTIADVAAGQYQLRLAPSSGYSPSFPGGGTSRSVTLVSGQVLNGVDLGAARLPSSVVGRYIFYNNSVFDGNTQGPSASDDNAIAPDKQALLPGQTAQFTNYTSYSRGINGIMVDVANMPGVPTAADFIFAVGNSNSPLTWQTAPPPSSVTIRSVAGNATRITIIWPDGAIRDEWLQISVEADDTTGLTAPDVFYFGNAVGESGNDPTNAIVNAADLQATAADPHGFLNPATITNLHDYNRDGRVDATDELIARNYAAITSGNPLQLISVPATAAATADKPGAAPAGSLPVTSSSPTQSKGHGHSGSGKSGSSVHQPSRPLVHQRHRRRR